MGRANPLLGRAPAAVSDGEPAESSAPVAAGDDPTPTTTIETHEDERAPEESASPSGPPKRRRSSSTRPAGNRQSDSTPAPAEEKETAAAALLRQFGVDPEHRRVERPVLDLMPVRVPREVRDMVRVASQRAGMTQQEWVLRAVVAYLADTEPVLLNEASSS